MSLTKEQIEDRKNFIGGSDVPVIMGLSNYKTPYMLYLEKTGLASIDYEETEAQEWGKLQEPLIRKKFEKRHGVKAPEKNGVRHPSVPYIKGNLDGYIKKWNAVWEAKTTNEYMKDHWGKDSADDIPAEYLMQVATYVSCTNAEKAFISVLIGGNKYREYQYTRDLELEELILESAKDFWSCVQERREPDAINLEDLKIKYKKTDPSKILIINNEISVHLADLHSLKKEFKEIERQKVQSQMKVMEYMKDCESLVDIDGIPLASWKARSNGTRVFLLKGEER